MKSPNKFAVALALSRRIDRLDPVSALEAERIIAAVEAGESITGPLKSFFTDAWERLGRAAAAAGNVRETKAAIGHLAALAEVSDALGFGAVAESETAPISGEIDTENSHGSAPESATATSTEIAPDVAQNWS